MLPDKEAIYGKVRQWFEIAEEDYHLAKHSFLFSSPIPYRLIAYHCQQAAEKYFKELLALPDSFSNVQYLSDFAAAKRYPRYYEKDTIKIGTSF